MISRFRKIISDIPMQLGWKFHALYWALTALLSWMLYTSYGGGTNQFLLLKSFYFPFQLWSAYFLLWLTDLKLRKGRYLILIVLFVAHSYLISIFAYFLHDWSILPHLNPGAQSPSMMEVLNDIEGSLFYHFRLVSLLPLLLIILELFFQNLTNRQKLDQLATEKAKEEINYLRQRFNPQLLIKGLRRMEDLLPEQKERVLLEIDNLSFLLDYYLYKSQIEKIDAKEEEKAIKSYLKLHGLVHKSSYKIEQLHFLKNRTVKPLSVLDFVKSMIQNDELESSKSGPSDDSPPIFSIKLKNEMYE